MDRNAQNFREMGNHSPLMTPNDFSKSNMWISKGVMKGGLPALSFHE
eukprot:CAMPEP_0177237762 /NCGR_PEP_ID=MMETSP0367-20130122/46164_1 /TAXON_ID=447022 ORGANISM="Scrippsiella hangoei-like, Strain SHHI-4" /NCGR_SAMPLE_ID=MMETSP0367 /ASSEMBLY_ACC=CAM_ASM_000362 /LENGTH=46 /DNA_ID= /DNA_START= /DNA_END= /DNA_ORIENTATION=